MKLGFSRQIFEKCLISVFINIRPVGAELFRADGHEVADGCYSQFCGPTLKSHVIRFSDKRKLQKQPCKEQSNSVKPS